MKRNRKRILINDVKVLTFLSNCRRSMMKRIGRSNRRLAHVKRKATYRNCRTCISSSSSLHERKRCFRLHHPWPHHDGLLNNIASSAAPLWHSAVRVTTCCHFPPSLPFQIPQRIVDFGAIRTCESECDLCPAFGICTCIAYHACRRSNAVVLDISYDIQRHRHVTMDHHFDELSSKPAYQPWGSLIIRNIFAGPACR